MQGTKAAVLMIFFISFLAGCSTTGSLPTDTKELQKSNDIKTVSVLTFTCSSPVIARDVRNVIIESLLSGYSVVIGDNADVVIRGDIILSGDQVSTASEGYVSEMRAQIIENSRILDSIVVTQVGPGSSTPEDADVMGRKMGKKIKESLSNFGQ
jgi:hypothetical protein